MDFSKLNGLIPAVIQDLASNEVLMVGFMNQEALDRTVESGFATFFSRTRNAFWMKGETSGNRLKVERILVDCDEDTVLVMVTRLGDGNVCHTGERSCFSRTYEPPHPSPQQHERTGDTGIPGVTIAQQEPRP
jgi:phosphoribosyl-AMP cyclohydrolase